MLPFTLTREHGSSPSQIWLFRHSNVGWLVILWTCAMRRLIFLVAHAWKFPSNCNLNFVIYCFFYLWSKINSPFVRVWIFWNLQQLPDSGGDFTVYTKDLFCCPSSWSAHAESLCSAHLSGWFVCLCQPNEDSQVSWSPRKWLILLLPPAPWPPSFPMHPILFARCSCSFWIWPTFVSEFFYKEKFGIAYCVCDR